MTDTMTGPDHDPPDHLLEEAADWRLRLDESPRDPGLRKAHAAWLARDEAHRRAWELSERAWGLAGQALRQPAALPRPAPRAALAGLALAASLVLAAVLGHGLLGPWGADHRTRTGETARLELPDGSAVSLGAGSALAVEFSERRRAVRLLGGQAFFTVSPNRERSFVVDAGGVEVTVIGTAFDVALDAGRVSVAVAEGRVSVGALGRTEDLAPGQAVTIDPAGGTMVRAEVPPALVAAWRTGWLYVADASLRHVVAVLERHHVGLIVVRDEALLSRRVTGAFNLDDPAGALRALGASHGAAVREVSPFLLVLSDQKK